MDRTVEVIGRSPAFHKVLDTAEKIAARKTLTILLSGESGTGKEVIARLIHDMSCQPHQPFIDINCGALPETLLESELFGHEKGAFTGASVQKPGLFELANGGTIFLDEISNTSLNLQIKLLKAVETKRFRRVNGVEEVSVSTRIIAATNVPLEQAVREGRFREDLYYRLNVCAIDLPPLRQRGHDCLQLADHFIKRFNNDYELNVVGLTDAARDFLLRYTWPGNIRQLKNTLERAVLVESDEWVDIRHLQIDSLWGDERLQGQSAPSVESPVRVIADQMTFEDTERFAISSALTEASGNVSEAARLLKINRGKLRYKMSKLGISAFERS